LDKECIERSESAIERVATAGAKVILTGSLAIGLIFPEIDGLLHPSDVASVAPLAHGEQDAFFYRSEASYIAPIHAKDWFIATVPSREHGGLHDHREARSIVVNMMSPIIVTGAGLSGQPDLWLNRA
jgi:hypothetical protein